jgi:hypothetical protein
MLDIENTIFYFLKYKIMYFFNTPLVEKFEALFGIHVLQECKLITQLILLVAMHSIRHRL